MEWGQSGVLCQVTAELLGYGVLCHQRSGVTGLDVMIFNLPDLHVTSSNGFTKPAYLRIVIQTKDNARKAINANRKLIRVAN